MSGQNLKKFLVFYTIPAAVMADWAKVDPEFRKGQEQQMMADWQAWLAANSSAVKLTEVGCKTKRVTAQGAADMRNDIVLYSIVEAESHEAATQLFEKHPHLRIPQASIEVMETRPM